MDQILLGRRTGRPLRIWVSKGPKRDKATKAIRDLGGEPVTSSAAGCAYALVDKGAPNLHKDWSDILQQNTDVTVLDTRWIFDCLQRKKRVDCMDYEVVRPASPPRRATRTAYTQRDDRNLVKFLTRNPEMGRTGNAVYEQMEKAYPRHSWQSWRERFKKNEKRFDKEIDRYSRVVADRRWKLEDPFSASEDEAPRPSTSRPPAQPQGTRSAAAPPARFPELAFAHAADQGGPSNTNPHRNTSATFDFPSRKPRAAAVPNSPQLAAVRRQSRENSMGESDEEEDELRSRSQSEGRSQEVLAPPTKPPPQLSKVLSKRKRSTDFISTSEDEDEEDSRRSGASTAHGRRKPSGDSALAVQRQRTSGDALTAVAVVKASSTSLPTIFHPQDIHPRNRSGRPGGVPLPVASQLVSVPLHSDLRHDEWSGDNLDSLLTASQMTDLTFVCSNSVRHAREIAGLLSLQQVGDLTQGDRTRLKELTKVLWAPEEDATLLTVQAYDALMPSLRKRHTEAETAARRQFLLSEEGGLSPRKRFPFDV